MLVRTQCPSDWSGPTVSSQWWTEGGSTLATSQYPSDCAWTVVRTQCSSDGQLSMVKPSVYPIPGPGWWNLVFIRFPIGNGENPVFIRLTIVSGSNDWSWPMVSSLCSSGSSWRMVKPSVPMMTSSWWEPSVHPAGHDQWDRYRDVKDYGSHWTLFLENPVFIRRGIPCGSNDCSGTVVKPSVHPIDPDQRCWTQHGENQVLVRPGIPVGEIPVFIRPVMTDDVAGNMVRTQC